MQAIGPTTRESLSPRRLTYGVVAAVAFGLFLVLNFWPGWQAMPFLTNGMVLTIGSIDLVLWAIIAFHVAYFFSDRPGLHVFAHLVIAFLAMFAFTRLLRTMPFALASGVWPGVVHWLLVLGAVVAFLVIPATWWQMIGLGYEDPGRRRH